MERKETDDEWPAVSKAGNAQPYYPRDAWPIGKGLHVHYFQPLFPKEGSKAQKGAMKLPNVVEKEGPKSRDSNPHILATVACCRGVVSRHIASSAADSRRAGRTSFLRRQRGRKPVSEQQPRGAGEQVAAGRTGWVPRRTGSAVPTTGTNCTVDFMGVRPVSC